MDTKQTDKKKLLVFEMTALRLLLEVTKLIKLDKLRNENIREQLSKNKTILQVIQHVQHSQYDFLKEIKT